jgi:hypothetical protein
VDAGLERAIAHAKAKASRLQNCGLALSANDRRVILIGQFLVEVCAGRSAVQLGNILSEKLTELDLAALRLLEMEETPEKVHRLVRSDERQMVLLERHSTRKPRICR